MQDPQMPIPCIENSIRNPLTEWVAEVCDAAERLGRPVTNSKRYGQWMQEAGFTDIVERHFHWP